MENIVEKKINVGISACQYGCKVRYNKKGWDMLGHMGRQSSEFVWHPVCPEVMSGMGVPRTPIKLTGGNGDDFWEGKAEIRDRNGRNMTKMVKEGALACLETLKRANVSVYIFMEGSPSCGVYRTTLKNKRLGKPPGIFGSLLLKEEFFLIPSADLQSPIKWWDWRRRMFAFTWFKEKEFEKLNDIVEIWHILKFLCQDISRIKSDEIGRKIADGKNLNSDMKKDIRKEISELLRKPVEVKQIKQSLWKNYSFLKKKYGIEVEKVQTPLELRNITHLAEEVLALEILTSQSGILFGSVPVHYDRKDRQDKGGEK